MRYALNLRGGNHINEAGKKVSRWLHFLTSIFKNMALLEMTWSSPKKSEPLKSNGQPDIISPAAGADMQSKKSKTSQSRSRVLYILEGTCICSVFAKSLQAGCSLCILDKRCSKPSDTPCYPLWLQFYMSPCTKLYCKYVAWVCISNSRYSIIKSLLMIFVWYPFVSCLLYRRCIDR